MKAPPKILIHDQKVVVQRIDETNISQIQLEIGQLEGEEKREGGYKKRGEAK